VDHGLFELFQHGGGGVAVRIAKGVDADDRVLAGMFFWKTCTNVV
jgi:hypothetical protein